MRRGNLIFTIALLLVSILLLRATLPYPFKAKLFPLIILITVLILLIIQIVREVVALRVKGATEKKRANSFRSKHLTILFWMVGTVLMLWVLGFMGTVILLPFLYLRFEKESWLLSITLSLGCGVFFYGLFGYLLKMPLYPGMILERVLG
jgi:small-conductance mechanosensitive channel